MFTVVSLFCCCCCVDFSHSSSMWRPTYSILRVRTICIAIAAEKIDDKSQTDSQAPPFVFSHMHGTTRETGN